MIAWPIELAKESGLFENIFISTDDEEIAEKMKKGDMLNEKPLRIVRWGMGLPSKYYDIIIGKKVNQDVNKGTAVKWEYIGLIN
jgi:sialic acid synthase SpsE